MTLKVLPERPFTVILAGKRFRFTPCEGWFCVECLDHRGVITQGRTFDEACRMAVSALHEVEECERELGFKGSTAQKPARPAVNPSRPRRRRSSAEAVAV